MDEERDESEQLSGASDVARERRLTRVHVVITSVLALLTAAGVVVYASDVTTCASEGECALDLAALDHDAEPPALVIGVEDPTHGIVIDENGWVRVPKIAIDRALNALADFQNGCSLVPAFVGGRVVGLKLFSIRPGSFLAALGFANGDIVTRVGAYDLGDSKGAVAAVQAFQYVDALSVTFLRDGFEHVLVIQIER